MSNISQNDIDTLDSRFSTRMFIADLPRVLNEAFKTIKTVIKRIYDAGEHKITVDKASVGTLTTSTLITNNITFAPGSDDVNATKNINYSEIQEIKRLADKIGELEDRIDALEHANN